MKDVYLQSNIYKVLTNDISEGMVNHAYLLISSDKFKINCFTKFMCCTFLSGSSEFDDITSTKIFHGNHADVKVFPASNKTIVTEDINKIVDDSLVLPMEAEKKIYVLKNFDQATVQAQNKLLKTLEEPPKSVVFLITTSNEDAVLPTIRSRCKKVVEGKTEDKLVESYIKNNSNFTKDEVEKIVRLSDGNLTFVDSYLNDKKYFDMVALSEEIFNHLQSSALVLKYATKMLKYKANLEDFLNVMTLTLRNMFVEKKTQNKTLQINYSDKALYEISKVLNEGIKKIKSNCNPNSVCDGVLMGILEVRYKCQK